jgi:hypothetical protein
MTKESGKAAPAASRKKAVSGKAAKLAASKAKFARLQKLLAGADSQTIASLVRDLDGGKRRVSPGVTLSAYEAGSLAAQLHGSLKPGRHGRKKIEYDHIT